MSSTKDLALAAAALCLMTLPVTANDSLTIATYNTHLVPHSLRCAEQVDIGVLIASGAVAMASGALVVLAVGLPEVAELVECLARSEDTSFREAGPIAAEILRRNPDVVALNEVFDEDARQRLIDELGITYPHRVEYVNSGPDLEDSGLMLFSKFPFGSLANPAAVFRDGTVRGTTDQVAFVEYDWTNCAHTDCLASKGAAFVKIMNPRPGRTIPAWDVVLTHMQAAYEADDEYGDVRKEQFSNIQDMIREATRGGEPTPLFILGDLNIEGEGGRWDVTISDAVAGTDEWRDFARRAKDDPDLTDAWATTTSELDLGITNHRGSLGDMRLDYVLSNGVENAPCMQHLTLAYLGNSDHIAVIANTNRQNDFCSPRTAWQRPPLETHLRSPTGSGDLTRIVAPGTMQWFFVELPEAASGAAIGTTRPFEPSTGQGVAIELFAPQDLTNPIPPTSIERFMFGETVTQKYVLPRTFFVRVFSPSPTWTGNYDLFIHELACSSPLEACPLRVNDPRRYDALFVPGTALGPDDTAWFEISVTDRADSGKPQQIRVFADEFENGLLEASLETRDGTPPLMNQADNLGAGVHSISGSTPGPRSFYLVVRRADLNQGSLVRVGWESNLTRLGGVSIGVPGARSANLVCDDETDGVLGSEAGKDEISLLVRVDKTAFREVVYHEFDCNTGPVPLIIEDKLGTIRFIEEVVFTLYERDTGTIFNPDDESQWIIIHPVSVSHFGPSQNLPPDAPDILRVLRQVDFARWDFEGGRYHLEYNLSHQIGR